MSAVEKTSRISLEEFFAYVQDSPTKAEYYKGEVFDMAGGTPTHSQIQGNTITSLNIALRDNPCIVHTSDMMVRIEEADAVFFPDVQVLCGDTDSEFKTISPPQPSVIVEVLSASRAAYDRGGKFQCYMKIRSLREYILIEQDTMQVDVFSRPGFGEDWTYRSYTHPGELVAIPSLGIQIPVSEIYLKVVFGQAEV